MVIVLGGAIVVRDIDVYPWRGRDRRHPAAHGQPAPAAGPVPRCAADGRRAWRLRGAAARQGDWPGTAVTEGSLRKLTTAASGWAGLADLAWRGLRSAARRSAVGIHVDDATPPHQAYSVRPTALALRFHPEVERTAPNRLALTWARPNESDDTAKRSRVSFDIEPKGVVPALQERVARVPSR